MSYARVRITDIEVGRPLQWNVYDKQGTLLLSKGYVLATERQVDRLIAVGVFASSNELRESRMAQLHEIGGYSKASESDDAEAQEGGLWLDARKTIEALYEGLEVAVRNKRFESTIAEVAQQVDQLCTTRPELALAVISLRQLGRYSCRHMLDTAVVVRLVSRSMGLPADREVSVVCAALTMNLTTAHFQDEIKIQRTPLTVEQRDRLRHHPLEAMECMHAMGAGDAVWLRAVAEHHERIDGSGYPNGLKGGQISMEGQILGLADVYCARITFKEYRAAVPATVALRGILQERSKAFDPALTSSFIKAIGIFPPGLLVRLANGDQAVVVRAGTAPNFPMVASLLDAQGAVYSPAQLRDSAQAEFNVKETVDPATFSAYVDLNAIWV